MANLNVNEIDVLREIIHHSLKISIEQLADDLATEVDLLLPILDKLSATKLFTRQNKTLVVDKEMRKYFEVEIEKFDENFRPDIEFMQTILGKVPINILLTWYAIPRTSDNIFDSIIEKYLLTPKNYRLYLSELQFDNPILNSIVKEVHTSPDFMVSTHDLMMKFNLNHEELEESLLLLEYHFVCCVSYKKIEGKWKEMATPFAEWRDFLSFNHQTKPRPLSKNSIHKTYPVEFAFIKDLASILQASQTKQSPYQNISNLHGSTDQQKETLAKKLIQLEFAVKVDSHTLSPTQKGNTWLSRPLVEQIALIANDPLNRLAQHHEFSELWNMRNLGLIEKNLRRLSPLQWISFQNFFEGFIAPIGNHDPVILKNKGKKWQYTLPIYSENEKQFTQAVIMERLAQLGMVETGIAEGMSCFCLTPFGYHIVH
ncbi:MAG: hypothetical protein ACH350_05610 [Parachlamydiaceae bacterium]